MNTIRMFFMFRLELFSCSSQRKSEAIPVLPRLTNFFTILLMNFNNYNHQSGNFKLEVGQLEVKSFADFMESYPNVENLVRKLNFSMFS